MQSIAKFFTDNYKFTFVMSLGVLIFGIGGIMQLNAESYPSVDFAVAKVTTVYDGATAEDIEVKITKPIEDELRKVSGVKDVRSTSQMGRSIITIRGDIDNVDVSEVMGDLQRAVDRVTDLPSDLKERPKFTEIKSDEFPVIELAVVGPSEGRERDLVADLLKEELEDHKSVQGVRLVGFTDRSFNINLNNKALERRHIGVDQVLAAIGSRNVNTPGGKLEIPSAQKVIRIDGKVKSAEELADLVIRANYNGKQVRLKDVAEIVDGSQDTDVLSLVNGQPATLLVVTKKGGADTLDLVDSVEQKLDLFQKTHPEFDFVVYNNEGIRVKNKLSILTSNAITGLGLVVFFLLLFLPGRIGLVASLSLPLAILFTIGFMPAMGMNLNAVTIVAMVIALGMLVDNSVVISENYARLRSEGIPAQKAALDSIGALWVPITATVFTTIAAFLPMMVTKGIMGRFIQYIPIIVTLALMTSLLESFFLLPMRLIQTDKKQSGDDPDQLQPKSIDWFDRFSEGFERLVELSVHYRYVTFAIFTGLLITSITMMTVFNKVVLFPAEQTEIYTARVEFPEGMTQQENLAKMKRLTQKISAVAGDNIDNLVSRSGSAQTRQVDPKSRNGDNVGMVFIYVNEFTKNNVSDRDFLKTLRSVELQGARNLSYEAMNQGPPVGDPVTATLRSNDGTKLSQVVERITDKLLQTEGVIDVSVDDIRDDDQIYIDVDYTKAAMLGLNVQSIGNVVRTAVSGRKVSSVNLNNKDIDIKVALQNSNLNETADLSSLRIMDRRGNLIPLSTVAKLHQEDGSNQIKRYDYKRARTITAGIEDTKITAIEANDIVKTEFTALQGEFPEVSLVFGGEAESTAESMSSLFNALVLSLIGIFALLVLLFNSFTKPFIIMSTIPLGLVGFSIAFAAHGKPISFLAMIGIIGLGGIIVNSGIILISFIDSLRKESDAPMPKLLARASKLRLRAVLVSSLTTISGLLPTAYGIGGMDAFLLPMTLAMAWGLTSGTILTLMWVPSAYAILEDVSAGTQWVTSRIHPSNWLPSGSTEELADSKIVAMDSDQRQATL